MFLGRVRHDALSCMPQHLVSGGWDVVDKMHDLIDRQVDEPNDNRHDDGSNHHDDCTIGKLALAGPRNLMNEFVIRLLDIRKYFIFLHLD